MTDQIRYDLLVQDALRGVVRRVLTEVARDGLPGDHHFYVSFRTDKPGVRISTRLRERYPQDMTIVLQHQFDGLALHDHAFEVGLSFSGVAERLRVPFDALTGFFDPSVQFGLKFESQEMGAPGVAEVASDIDVPPSVPRLPTRKLEAVGDGKPAKSRGEKRGKAATAPEASKDEPAAAESSAEVVSLDAFRKKS